MKILTIALFLVLSAPVHADTLDTVSFTITGSLTGSGTLTINPDDAGLVGNGGVVLESGDPIVGLTGTIDGLPMTMDGEALWFSGDISHFVPLSFYVGDGVQSWVWESSPPEDFGGDGIIGPNGTYDTANFTYPNPDNPIIVEFGPLTPATDPVPEPKEIIMLLVGLLGIFTLNQKIRR